MEGINKSKKKILVVVPEFPRLTETFIERDISQLATYEDLDVKVFSLKRASGFLSANLEDKVIYQRLTYNDVFFGFLKFFLGKPIKTLGLLRSFFTPDAFDDASFSHRFVLLSKGVAYTAVIQKLNVDELHLHFLSEFSTVAMVPAVYLDMPFSLNVHAKDVLFNPSLPVMKIQRAKFTAVCNKNAYARCCEMAGSYAEKVHLIYHGLDESRLATKNSYLVKPARPLIFLNVSRFVEKKGLIYMLEAAKILVKRGIDFEVAIVGANDSSVQVNMYEQHLSQIKEKGLTDIVKIYGEGKGVAFEEVTQFYKIADIFVSTSISENTGDADGVPNALIEAALSKLPIIATDAGSIRDFLDSTNSLEIPQRSSEAIADAIEKLIADVSLREELGKKAYFDAKEKFSSAKNVLLLHKLLLE